MAERYFIVKRIHWGCRDDETDIMGLTMDESVAKSYQSVFSTYEEVKILPPLDPPETYFMHIVRGNKEVTLSGKTLQECEFTRQTKYPDWKEKNR